MGGHGFCHIMRHAVMILFFLYRTGQVSNTSQHKGWVRVLCSLSFALYVILGGGLWVTCLLACLKTQLAHKPLIHHDEKHDFFLHLINLLPWKSTMKICVYSSPPLERPPCGSHKGGL